MLAIFGDVFLFKFTTLIASNALICFVPVVLTGADAVAALLFFR